MRRALAFVAVLAAAATAAAPASAQEEERGCGTGQRWLVKTWSDPRAGWVDPAVRDRSVRTMTSLPAPRHPTLRNPPYEARTYRIKGRLIAVRNQADGDKHVELRGRSGRRMITETPSPNCTRGASAGRRAWMTKARHQVNVWVARHGTRARCVVVRGIGFWDNLHAGAGPNQARNGIELHPITAFRGCSSSERPSA